MKEDSDRNRFPLIREGKAVIHVKDGLYIGKTINGEVIAISDDINVVEERLKHAESDVNIRVRYDSRSFTVQGYINTKLPRIFRIAYSDAVAHGLIIAVDHYKNGYYSDIRLFYDVDELISYIKRVVGRSDNFYLYGRQPREDFREQLGGIKAFDLPWDMQNINHLRELIKTRQQVGSHEAVIKEIEEERRKIRVNEYHGSLNYDTGEYENEY